MKSQTFSNGERQDRVAARWPSAEDFYAERDDRTLRAAESFARYANRPVDILIDPVHIEEKGQQQLALIAANLTARWARNINMVLPLDVSLVPDLTRGRFALLVERLAAEMYGADPFGSFQFIPFDEYERRDESSLRLFLGPWDRSPSNCTPGGADLVVSAVGEYVVVRRGMPILHSLSVPEFTPAIGLAASISVADLFKRAVQQPGVHWIPCLNWNVLDHSIVAELSDAKFSGVTDAEDIGRILLGGVGAIGSSLVYLLDMADVTGRLTNLDRDRVETSNLNRSLIFEIEDVLRQEYKTVVAERFLSSGKLIVDRLDGTWREHAKEISNREYDVWISFTNEEGAWAEIPFQFPPVVLQGTTTSGWGFGAGRHIPRKEDCTLCRMPRPEIEFRGPCAEGEIEPVPTEPPIRASLPFLSAASASLVLAELFKLDLLNVRTFPNDVAADLKTGLPAVIATTRLADENCNGCRILGLPGWVRKGGRGRYRGLST